MKKFTTTFFLLLALVLLLPIKMKAEDVYLLCNADGAGWTKETGLKFEQDGDVYKLNVPASKITNDGNQLRFRVGVNGWGGEMCPYSTNNELTAHDFSANILDKTTYKINEGCYTDNSGVNSDSYFYFDKGTYDSYNFTVSITENNRYIKVEGVTSSGGDGGDGGDEGGSGGDDDDEHGMSSNGKAYYLVSVGHDNGANSTDNIFAEEETALEDEAHQVHYNRILRFNDNANGEYTLVIPATITGKVYIEEVPKSREASVFYGPTTNNQQLGDYTKQQITGKFNSTATEGNVNAWQLTDIGDYDGSYLITIKLDKKGEPIDWEFDYNANRRVSYFLSTATMSSAYAVYNTRGQGNDSFSNKFEGYNYFDAAPNTNYYVISNIINSYEDNRINVAKTFDATVNINTLNQNVLPTLNKLFLLGNGGKEFGSGEGKENQFFPNAEPMLTSKDLQGLCKVEYNPSNGFYENSIIENHYGIAGQIICYSGATETVSMAIVGPLFNKSVNSDGSWDYGYLSTEDSDTDAPNNVMTYNDTKHCFEIEVETTGEQNMKDFVFVANRSANNIWYDFNRTARNPYYGPYDINTSAATVQDANHVKNGTSSADDNKYIQFNRPAGKWTISFYFVTNSATGETEYYYTISSEDNITVPVPPKTDKDGKTYVLRTFSYGADLTPDDPDVHIYAAQKFSESGKDSDTETITGQVNLYEISYIPADEGVVLFYKNAEEAKEVTFRPANEYNTKNYPKCRTDKKLRWVYEKEEEYNNDLVQVLEDKFIEQSVYDEDGEAIIARNFGLNFFSNTNAASLKDENSYTDYIGFFRLRGTVRANQAYLQYDNEEVKGNAQIFGQDTDGTQLEKDENATQNSKLAIIFEGFNDNGTTGIKDVTAAGSNSANDCYYNLQGIRVTSPGKGIYIHNGRKVIIK